LKSRSTIPLHFAGPYSKLALRMQCAASIRKRLKLDPGLLAMAQRGEATSRQAYMEAVEAGMILGRQMRLFHQN
jgi:hypothetical protein